MNRLANHFAALGLAQPESVQKLHTPPTVTICDTPAQLGESPSSSDLKHCPHYRIARYTPSRVSKNWKPGHAADCVNHLQYKQVRFGERHGSVTAAMAQVLAENTEALSRRSFSRWSTIAYVDGPGVLPLQLARVVLPLRYRVVPVSTPARWEASSLLCAPPWEWSETLPGNASELTTHGCLCEAVKLAVSRNRRYRRKKKRNWALWHVVLAFEADALTSTCHYQNGLACSQECSRFHVVDETWPLGDDVRELLKGGAR